MHLENPRAGKQRLVHLKKRIFRGCPDERQQSVFYMRQKGILLGFVPAVNLINKKERPLVVKTSSLLCVCHHSPQLLHSRQNRGNGNKIRGRSFCDQLCQGGLSCPGRTEQQDRGKKTIRLNCPAQQPAFADNVILTD